MSNIKRALISFQIDFDFASMDSAGNPGPMDAIRELKLALFSMACMPSVGLRLSWTPAPPRHGPNGSITSRYCCTIDGQEAFSFAAFENLRGLIDAVPNTTIVTWIVLDCEDGGCRP